MFDDKSYNQKMDKTFNDNEYKYICFCLNTQQAAIQIF